LKLCQSIPIDYPALLVFWPWQELEKNSAVPAFELGVMPALRGHQLRDGRAVRALQRACRGFDEIHNVSFPPRLTD
jgi:hypothetical protein